MNMPDRLKPSMRLCYTRILNLFK